MNLNDDATNLILDVSFVRFEIKTNDSKEENLDDFCRNRDIVDVNPSLDFPNIAVSNRKNLFS